jgi:hypothetical protein
MLTCMRWLVVVLEGRHGWRREIDDLGFLVKFW